MDQHELRRLEDLCIQEWAPWCTAMCPVHVDVRAMTAAVTHGDFQAAAKFFVKSVPFPRIISRVCDHPCESACKRREAGEAIAIRALERAVVANAASLSAGKLRVPQKESRVAVVGAGLSGLTAALELDRKGYRVVLFEATDKLGGSVWDFGVDQLPRTELLEDFETLGSLRVEFRLTASVDRAGLASTLEQDFDAVYIGTGRKSPCPFSVQLDAASLIMVDPLTFQTSTPGVFAGGSAIAGHDGQSRIRAISDGRRAAISIDRFLQKVSLSASREREGTYETRLFTNIQGATPLPRVPAGDRTGSYSPDEARAEAGRCFQCECMECVKICEYLAHYKGYPRKYIRHIYNNLSIVMGQRHGNTFINSCSLCGLCKEVCPESLHMGEVCKAARAVMVSQGKMPPSAHEFALEDMTFSNSDKAALVRHQPGTASSASLFFPGCQLAGSSPDHVIRTYEYLTHRLEGGVGLMLGCCGAPADWVGRVDDFSQVMNRFRNQWLDMGSPQLILACSSCYAVFKAHLPEARVVSLWEVMDRIGVPSAKAPQPQRTLAIHDPCTSRHEAGIQQCVRKMVRELGYDIAELDLGGEQTECCGFGGLMYFANREVAEKVIQRRINETELDLLVYCAVCRDHFASRGKPTWHLLDLIFGQGPGTKAPLRHSDYSQQRENRFRLKNRLLTELWSEKGVEPEGYQSITLRIPEQIRDLMQDRMILVEDLQKVIQWAEKTGNKLVHSETGHSLAHYRPGAVTYWVEYSLDQDEYLIHNTYCHRMEILEELKP
jgi:glutamate synthase (NADPH) small chain